MLAPSDNPRWAPFVAGVVSFIVYAFTASGHGYWLDSGEFIAAAVQLDIPHPPGHPLANLWGKLFTLLPVGPLSYRVAIGQAVAAALALCFAQVAIARSVGRVAELPAHARVLLSLAATWTLAGSYGFWFQAVRAEVYALEALLVCVALERMSALACTERVGDPRPMYLACLALGFGLANHHFIALLALPALLYELVRLLRAGGAKVILGSLVAGSIGLLTYVYLPLRALREGAMDLGHPATLSDFLWVVSARVYARNIGSSARQPLDERFADLALLVVENFTFALLPLMLLGAYVLARRQRTRALAYLWLVTATISLGGRAYLNPVRANPDVLGYMMPGFVALAALAACAVASLLELLPRRPAAARVGVAICALLTVASLHQFQREAPRSSLRTFQAAEHFDELRRRNLPTRALLVLTTPASIFRHWEGDAVEQLRADVTMVPIPFLGYGSTHEVLLRRHPELRELVSAYLTHGELSLAALRRLAEQRPVLLELDTRVSLPLFESALADSLLYAIAPSRVERSAVERAALERVRTRALLQRRLAAELAEPETRKQLLWVDYMAALQLAHLGHHELARDAVRSALALSPHARELLRLREALVATSATPLDIGPFLPGQPTP